MSDTTTAPPRPARPRWAQRFWGWMPTSIDKRIRVLAWLSFLTEVIIIGTGSELELALGAADEVRASGVRVRVVSMPSRDLFDAQRQEYREQILPVDVSARVVVEAASPFGWRDVVGDKGVIVGIDHFGASGPADEVLRECGMTVGDVVKAIDRVLAG